MLSLMVTTPFLLKVLNILRPLIAPFAAATVPRECAIFLVKIFASSPEILVAPRKVVWIAIRAFYWNCFYWQLVWLFSARLPVYCPSCGFGSKSVIVEYANKALMASERFIDPVRVPSG